MIGNINNVFNFPMEIESQLKYERDDKYMPKELLYTSALLNSSGLLNENKFRTLALFKQAAELEYPMALTSIGAYYYNGDVLPQSAEKAATCWSLAANMGDRDAMYLIAGFYSTAEAGFPKDDAKHVSLLKQAARQGHPMAIEELEELGISVTVQGDEYIRASMNNFLFGAFGQGMIDNMFQQQLVED